MISKKTKSLYMLYRTNSKVAISSVSQCLEEMEEINDTCGNQCKEKDVIEKSDFDKSTSGLTMFRSLYWRYATDGVFIYAEREGGCHKCDNRKLAAAMKKMEARQYPNGYIPIGSDHSLHIIGVGELLSLAKIVIDYADAVPEFLERVSFNVKNSRRIEEYKAMLSDSGFILNKPPEWASEIKDIPAHNDYENREVWTEIVKSVSDAENMLEYDEYGFPIGLKKGASEIKTKIIGNVRHLRSIGFLRKITL